FVSGVKRILVRRFATYLQRGVPGNWVLQSDLQNPNRTRMDWASRVSRSGIGAAGPRGVGGGAPEGALGVVAQTVCAELHSHRQRRALVPAARLLPEMMLRNGRAARAVPQRRRRRPRTQ